MSLEGDSRTRKERMNGIRRQEVPAGLRVIEGNENYGVSADGTVWSRARGEAWRPLATSLNTRGMPKVKLGHSKSVTVNALIAAAFIGPRPEGMTIEHLDGNRCNTAASNLRYVTQGEANARAWREGSQRSGWPTRRNRLALMGYAHFGVAGGYPD